MPFMSTSLPKTILAASARGAAFSMHRCVNTQILAPRAACPWTMDDPERFSSERQRRAGTRCPYQLSSREKASWRSKAGRAAGARGPVSMCAPTRDVVVDQSPDRTDAVQRVEEEPVVFDGAPPRLDHGVLRTSVR